MSKSETNESPFTKQHIFELLEKAEKKDFNLKIMRKACEVCKKRCCPVVSEFMKTTDIKIELLDTILITLLNDYCDRTQNADIDVEKVKKMLSKSEPGDMFR